MRFVKVFLYLLASMFLIRVVMLSVDAWNWFEGLFHTPFFFEQYFKDLLAEECTRTINLVSIVVVLVTRGWWYFGILFIGFSFLNKSLRDNYVYGFSRRVLLLALAVLSFVMFNNYLDLPQPLDRMSDHYFRFPDKGNSYLFIFDLELLVVPFLKYDS